MRYEVILCMSGQIYFHELKVSENIAHKYCIAGNFQRCKISHECLPGLIKNIFVVFIFGYLYISHAKISIMQNFPV